MKVIAVVPAYNEEKMIAEVVKDLRNVVGEVLVIDDGSRDSTARAAQNAGAVVLRHATNRGLGAALATGFAAAIERGGEAIVTFDADGQHDANDVPRLLEALPGVDIVIGSRWIKKYRPVVRCLYNRLANVFTYLLFGVWSTDTQSGLRLFSRDAAMKLELHAERMDVSSEIFAEIGRLKLTFREIRIIPRYTEYSQSKGQNFFVGLATLGRLFLRRLTR